MNQTNIVLNGEGDAWFARNRERLGKHDPVDEMIQALKIAPESVLEIGCSNGWRLQKLRRRYRCDVRGIDASSAAVRDAWDAGISGVTLGRADHLLYGTGMFDLVIFGFCLYLCEPGDLFRIATEADRVLRDYGHLIIHDFADHDPPFARKYEHHRDMLSYHLDFAKLWLAHPWYRQITSRLLDNDKQVTVLRKQPNLIPVTR